MSSTKHSIQLGFLIAAAFVLAAQPASADVVHADDVIVHGNICVGSTDCADGRVFSSDLEVSSLNPEIHFFDTSVGHDDWEIEVDLDNLRFRNHVDGGSVFNVATLSGGAPANSLFVSPIGDIGLGTATPAAKLHVIGTHARFLVEDTGPFSDSNVLFQVRDASTPTFQLENTGNNTLWNMTVNAFGDYLFKEAPDPLATMRLEKASGNLVLPMGKIVTQGPTCSGGGCDFVFQPGYKLEPIEAHAEYMWKNSHLPGVGPTPENAPSFDVTEKVGGILNELEKAHIYIERLNEEVKQQKAALAAKDAELKELMSRVARLESHEGHAPTP